MIDEAAIVILFAALAPQVIAVTAMFMAEPPPPRVGRHVAPPSPGVRVAGPDTGPLYFGALYGHTTAVSMPGPRPYTPAVGIPVLAVARSAPEVAT